MKIKVFKTKDEVWNLISKEKSTICFGIYFKKIDLISFDYDVEIIGNFYGSVSDTN